ncbi:MAG TPA: MFS transporter [Oscillatoriaceae cyanobacterium]
MAGTTPTESRIPDASQAPSSGRWWVLVAVGTGTFMSALDGSVVNTILPILNRAFHGGVAGVEWVVTIYLLVVSGLLLSFGRVGDLFGHKPIYVSGLFIFGIGSALCGAAPSLDWLVGFRALQAIGAAMLFANSPAILTTNFPAAERGRALGLQATMTYLGLTTGPSLGGWLAQTLSWRAVFYINVPVAVVTLLLTWRFVPWVRPAKRPPPFDFVGAGVFLVGLTLLLLALNQGHAWGWLSPATLGTAAAAIALLAGFVRLELRNDSPMLDLRLFRSRVFSGATLSAVFNYVGVFGLLFLIPFYLIQGRGMTPASAGLLMTAQPVVMAVVAPISGALSDRVGTRWPAVIGMALMAAGFWAMAGLGPTTDVLGIAWRLALVGLGTGIFISPNNSALMGAAPRNEQGVAGGVLATARNVGMVLGVGVAGAIFTTLLGTHGARAPLPVIAHAADFSFWILAGVALLGALTSAVR